VVTAIAMARSGNAPGHPKRQAGRSAHGHRRCHGHGCEPAPAPLTSTHANPQDRPPTAPTLAGRRVGSVGPKGAPGRPATITDPPGRIWLGNPHRPEVSLAVGRPAHRRLSAAGREERSGWDSGLSQVTSALGSNRGATAPSQVIGLVGWPGHGRVRSKDRTPSARRVRSPPGAGRPGGSRKAHSTTVDRQRQRWDAHTSSIAFAALPFALTVPPRAQVLRSSRCCVTLRARLRIVSRTLLADGGGWTFDPTGSEKTAYTWRLRTVRVRLPAPSKAPGSRCSITSGVALGTLRPVHRHSTALGCRCGG
jgi:hypothetical protein